MTTSLQKQPIKQSWPIEKIQEAARHFAGFIISDKLLLLENSPQAADPLCEQSAERKAELFKSLGVKTPMDLVRHMAEFEVNLFGAQASISGDDNKAVLFNEKPAAWLEAKKIANMSPEQEKEMQKHHEQWLKNLAEKLGFSVEVDMAADRNSETLTFSRK